MKTTIPSKETCFKCGEPANTERDSRVNPTLSMRMCQHCRTLELGCKECGSTDPSELPRGVDLCWPCADAENHQRECQEREADFSPPPCEVPVGLTLQDAKVYSPYEGNYLVVEHYIDGTGSIVAKRQYDCRSDEECSFTEEQWFDADGNLHREDGPAHIKYEHHRIPEEIYLNEDFQDWYLHGKLITAPPCEVPEGLTLANAVVTSPYEGCFKVVEDYRDKTGFVVARRIYEEGDDGESYHSDEQWFDAEGLLHRENGPAHMREHNHWIAAETYLDEAFKRWYTHGSMTRDVDRTYEDVISKKSLSVRQYFGYDLDE